MDDARTSPRASAAAAIALGLLGFLLIVELGGAAYFYLQERRLVYLNAASPAAPVPAEEATYKQRLHPYFGFTGPYSATLRTRRGTLYTNSLGFFQREELTLPVARAERDFIVAVFGGSVASNVVMAPLGGVQLGDALRKLPALEHRRVVVIDMAQGAGKQPQQLLELAYLQALGQSLDLVVTIDGFNELALGLENYRYGLDPILPAGLIIGGLAREVMPPGVGTVDYYEIAFRVSAAKRDLERHQTEARTARSGTAYLVDRALATLDQVTLNKHLERYAIAIAINATGDTSARWKMLGLDMPVEGGKPGIVRDLYSLWMRSTRQMRLLAAANHVGFLHIVQPNQYYSKKAFSDSEQRVALSLPPGHPYPIAVGEGYRMLEGERDPDVISAIPLFDRLAEDIYTDNCCHFNARGETMLAEFVAARVGAWLAAQTRSPPGAAVPAHAP